MPNDSIFTYLCSRVGDHLLSINDISLIGDTVAHAEAVISKLSRGPVRIVATAPPRNVTRPETYSPGASNGPIPKTTESKTLQLETAARSASSKNKEASSILKLQVSSSSVNHTGSQIPRKCPIYFQLCLCPTSICGCHGY